MTTSKEKLEQRKQRQLGFKPLEEQPEEVQKAIKQAKMCIEEHNNQIKNLEMLILRLETDYKICK